MALVISDRVKETTTTSGTGTYTLGGAVTGFETFTANLSDGDTTYYACTDNTDFEIGLGTFTTSGTTLARTTILASSNSGSAVNWAAGTRTIFCTLPAAKAVFLDASNVTNISNLKLASGATVTAILDEDTLSSDSATSLATQQSIKAYVDGKDYGLFNVSEDTTPQLGGDLDTNGNNIEFADNAVAIFGTGSDLQIYHDSSNSYISERGTGDLYVGANGNIEFFKHLSSDRMAKFITDGAVELYHANSKKIETTSSGVNVTGSLDVTDTSTTRTNLGLTIGTDVQAYDAQLADVAGLTPSDGNFIVGDGANFVAESGATARTSLGLGTAAVTNTGISSGNTLVADSTVADNDFLRINGTSVEGRSASEVLNDIGATTLTEASDEATALAIALG